MIELIKYITAPLAERINNLISTGSIKLISDKTKTQTMQLELFSEELRNDIENWQNYGISSHAPIESEAICLFPFGERGTGYVIAIEDKDCRPIDLKEGEVCLYTKEKDTITLKNGNNIEVKTKKLDIKSEEKVSIETKATDIKTSENLSINTKKISIKNDSAELIDVLSKSFEILSQSFEVLSTTTTQTFIGPTPLKDFAKFVELKGKIDEIKTKIDSFKS